MRDELITDIGPITDLSDLMMVADQYIADP